jgi:hypothetical protein
MRSEFIPPLPAPEEVIRRAERLGAKLIRSDDGWMLDEMPYTMVQLGYPNLCDSRIPRRVDSVSLKTADHYLRLCENRLNEVQRAAKRRHESFLS